MPQNLLGLVAGAIIATISSAGYLGIVALMAIESACIPLPSEIIMPFSGYLVATGRFELLLVATAGAIGNNIGSSLAYAVGYYGGRPRVEKWGRYVLLSRDDLDRVDRYFARFGSITVFFCRLLPVVRTFIALPAGIARMSQWRFQLYTFLGSWLWSCGLAYIGERLGASWETNPELRAAFHRFDGVIVAALAILFVLYVARHWRHRSCSRTQLDAKD